MRRHFLAPVLLLAPGVVLLLGFFAFPLGILGRYSLYHAEPGGMMVPAWVLDNYRRFLFDTFHLGILWTTLKLAFVVTAVSLVLGYPLAYSLARTRSPRARGIGIAILLMPLMTSVVVRSYGWMILLASSGLVNRMLLALGLVENPLQLMFTPRGVVIALSEVLLPYMVLSIMPVIQGIDPSLEEASQSLGARPIATFCRIVLPLSLPGVVAGCMLVFVLSITAFATPRLVGGSITQVISVFIYDQALSLFNWPFAAAVSWILLSLALLLTWLQGRLLHEKRGLGF